MTNEEAIKFLKIGKEDIDNEDFDEAIDIAIKAIELIEEITKNIIRDIGSKDLSSPFNISKSNDYYSKFYKDIMNYIPDCCKDCSNHPSNGGSGICNCALPYMTQTNTIRNFMTGTQSTGVDEYQININLNEEK